MTFSLAEPLGPFTLIEKSEGSATVPLMLRLVTTSEPKLFREPAGTLQRDRLLLVIKHGIGKHNNECLNVVVRQHTSYNSTHKKRFLAVFNLFQSLLMESLGKSNLNLIV